MKQYMLLIFTIIMLLALPYVAHAQASPASAPPAPCQSEWPKVYLVWDNTRHHILDWDTFLNLGYLTPDIVPCGDAADDPEGAPVTNLFKGSGVEVYLLKTGVRHHIPDMDTFNALGFSTADITILPDAFMAQWPVGNPLRTLAPVAGDTVYQEFLARIYTIRLWHPGQGMFNYATISQGGDPIVRVEALDSIVEVPPRDLTGDRDPDIIFLTHPVGSAHCCFGTVVYNLGSAPREILNILSLAYQSDTGRGDFQDIDGDGRYEFITHDPLTNIPCTQPSVYTILQYDPAQGKYIGATPHFAAYRADMIARYLRLPTTSDPCTIYPMVATLSYFGKTADARAAYDRLYRGDNPAAYWDTLQTAVQQGRFYVPAN
jgi:hypothetical protein